MQWWFDVSIGLIEVQAALQQSGCPICNISQRAASRYISQLLWENVNDVETRKKIIASLGYCPQHTEELVTTELTQHGSAMGTSIIYENLAQVVAKRLQTWQPPPKMPARQSIINRLRNWRRAPKTLPSSMDVLSVDSECRVCQIAERSARFGLSTFLEILKVDPDQWMQLYLLSDGLCLPHLRLCMEHTEEYPTVVQYLVTDTIKRLNDRRKQMDEYVRKLCWDARHEIISEAEFRSWKETLAFFSGLPPSKFGLDSREKDVRL
jgi:hypothetical protein